MAAHEARRITEITQQTLRFYRQSSLPTRPKMSELLDSVLSLYQGRLNSLNIEVEREYDPELDLFCFAGELRQVSPIRSVTRSMPPAAAVCGSARGVRGAGKTPRFREFASRWPTRERAWSQRCASASSRPFLLPRK